MANIKELVPKILAWEGGYVNDPTDKGGATNMGVTIATWRALGYDKDGDHDIDENDVRMINTVDYELVLRQYWNRWKADDIKNQSIANLLVDWVWGSGKWGIIIPQRILGVKADGIVGPITINAVNKQVPAQFFKKVYDAHMTFLSEICRTSLKDLEQKLGRKATPQEKDKHTNYKFLKGWTNRLKSFGQFKG